MTSPRAALAFCLLAAACTQSPEQIQAAAEQAVRAQLRDPAAARFVAINPCTGGVRGVTGLVASPEFADTDGFGAFVYVEGEAVLLRSETSRYPELLRSCRGS